MKKHHEDGLYRRSSCTRGCPPPCFLELSILNVHWEINGKSLLCGLSSKKSFNTDYPLQKIVADRVVTRHILWLSLFRLFQLPTEERSWLRFTYHSSIGPWGPMEVVMRASIKQFHYFRRPKGIAHAPIIRLLKLECQITLLWGKILSISYENSYYLMLIRGPDWQICMCLINTVWNKSKWLI